MTKIIAELGINHNGSFSKCKKMIDQKMNTLIDPNSSFSQTKISPISSREFNQKAKRPNYSFLASDKLKNDFGISLPNWKKSISKVIG